MLVVRFCMCPDHEGYIFRDHEPPARGRWEFNMRCFQHPYRSQTTIAAMADIAEPAPSHYQTL